MTQYRIVYRFKTRADGLVFDESYTAQRQGIFGWWFVVDEWYHGAGITDKERAQLNIDCHIRTELERKTPVQTKILDYP